MSRMKDLLWILGYTVVICPLFPLKYNYLGATLNLFLYLTTHIEVLCYLHTKWILTLKISYHLYLCHAIYTAYKCLLQGQHNISLFHGNQFLHQLARVFFEQWNSFSTSPIILQAHLGLLPSGPDLIPFFYWVNLVWPFPGIVPFILILEREVLVSGIFTLCRYIPKYNFLRDHFSDHLIKKNLMTYYFYIISYYFFH